MNAGTSNRHKRWVQTRDFWVCGHVLYCPATLSHSKFKSTLSLQIYSVYFTNFVISRTYQNISTLGKAAVQIIDDFNTATQNLDSAVSMIQTADQLMLLIQGNTTSELVDRMKVEFEAERNSSQTLRNNVMAVDFQTQGKDFSPFCLHFKINFFFAQAHKNKLLNVD